MERIFGEQRMSQEEALKKRRARIRELRKEGAAHGLEIDDAAIEKQVEEEEKLEKQKRKVKNYCFYLILIFLKITQKKFCVMTGII